MTLPNGFWWIRTKYGGAYLILLCTGHFMPLILCWNFHTKFHEYFGSENVEGMMAHDCYIIMMCTLCKECMSLLLETVHKEFLSVLSFFNGELRLLAAETTCQGFCPYSSTG